MVTQAVGNKAITESIIHGKNKLKVYSAHRTMRQGVTINQTTKATETSRTTYKTE